MRSTFDGDEQNAFETDGASVVVVGSAGSHDHGSSKIKLKNIVDYKWEVKNYVGRLMAVHLDGKYIAYAIKGNGSAHSIVHQMKLLIQAKNNDFFLQLPGKKVTKEWCVLQIQ